MLSKDGGIRGVEVPPSGRDLGWEKKSPKTAADGQKRQFIVRLA